MAKKETKEVVVEEVTTKEQPKADAEVGKIKVKKKTSMKKKVDTGEPIKVDLSKTKVKEEEKEVTKVDLTKENEEKTIENVEVKDSSQDFVLEEVTDEEVKEKPITSKEPELPENIQKVVDFMKDTGGDLQDYINLNQDYGKWESDELLRAYYKDTKPHLSDDEISFIMEDNFKYDETLDDEKDIKRKKLALKEQVASAKTHLDGIKSKYYEDIKMGSKLTSEQQEAIEFFSSYKEESEKIQQLSEEAKSIFLNKTDEIFNENFKGFEYKVGDKRYRFNVKDINQTKENQADINNFVKKFLNKDNLMEDAAGYHKGLFTAMNSDAIANHFYEQGKADALKESIAKSKNVNMDPRQELSNNINTSGISAKALNLESDFQFKIKKRK
tara:strand:+ start:2819 stop:3973 length:1155 start_codon:yes stop_codon:yes gene_type:complete